MVVKPRNVCVPSSDKTRGKYISAHEHIFGLYFLKKCLLYHFEEKIKPLLCEYVPSIDQTRTTFEREYFFIFSLPEYYIHITAVSSFVGLKKTIF